jgi:hypothetical protein
MTTVEKSIPLKLIGMNDGDAVVGFRMGAGQIILQVTNSFQTSEKPPQAVPAPKSIGDWINKWAGTMTLEPGETRESLRAAAMAEKFGS